MFFSVSKCPSCGANLQIGKYDETIFCPYCHSYIQRNDGTKPYGNNRENYANSESTVLESLLTQAATLEKLDNLFEANRKYQAITDNYPTCSAAWMGKCRTKEAYLDAPQRNKVHYADKQAYVSALRIETNADKKTEYQNEYQNYWQSFLQALLTTPKAFSLDRIKKNSGINDDYDSLITKGEQNAMQINQSLPVIPPEIETKLLKFRQKPKRKDQLLIDERNSIIQKRKMQIAQLVKEDLFVEEPFIRRNRVSIDFALGNTIIINCDADHDAWDTIQLICTPRNPF